MRILLVEDESGLVMTLTDRLRTEGYDVVTATDGDEGLSIALEGNLSAIILDVMLPKRMASMWLATSASKALKLRS